MADTITDSTSETWSVVDDEPEVEGNKMASVDSTLSWNTFLSRTSVSSLSCAVFSDQQSQAVHGLDDVIRSVKALNLRRYRYEDLVREESLGEGETYVVERCVIHKDIFAVKHLKIQSAASDKGLRRRLRSVILEVQIMKHGPLQAHPNFPSAQGYGWNVRGSQIVPYILVEYAPLGTLRQYFQKCEGQPLPRDIEILVGDVASALSALHTCGIVHGDVKLDNVLVFPSWDRPSKALAKLSDFGHALIMNDKSRKRDSRHMRYGGTLIYNAPEVKNQAYFPIDRADLPKCDIWSFGLLLWESCLGGKEYLTCVKESRQESKDTTMDDTIKPTELLRLAKRSVPGGANSLGIPMFLRISLHRTIQEDPARRSPNGSSIGLWSRWRVSNLKGLEADLALHLEAPTPTYEMFRSENGREIPWAHEEQIFRGLKQTHAENLAMDNSSIAWQIALCYHVGFGTSQNPESAYHYAEIAKTEGHPVATQFVHVLRPTKDLPSDAAGQDNSYPALVSTLLHSTSMSQVMPPLIKSCFDGDAEEVLHRLSEGDCPGSTTLDGCTLFHWLFMLKDVTAVQMITEKLRSSSTQLLVDLPTNVIREAHSQWPLQLCGTPLAMAISVNSIDAVRGLLLLGADPTCEAFHKGQFSNDDPRSTWTALHLAAKYHCSEILVELFKHLAPEKLQNMVPLPCVLSFSTSLELTAMHGASRIEQLKKTIALVKEIHPLDAAAPSGITALMQAIDFQDYDVVAALLEEEPGLASAELRSRSDHKLFNLPIHFAAQIAARRDALETLTIPKLINKYSGGLSPSAQPPRDNMKRTPLHLAVTGPSSLAAQWILEERPGLLQVEDGMGRTPLHCCASVANCDLLLSKGANVNHADEQGMTALHRACFLGELELVQGLLNYKPKLELSNNLYGTPLHCAIIRGSTDVTLALLDAGSPIDATDQRGNTPVHAAARMDRHAILRILIQRGADITLQNHNGRDARLIAAGTGRLGSVGVLRILNKGWEGRANERILAIDPEENQSLGNFGLQGPRGKPDLPPDFLWEKAKRVVNRNDAFESFAASSAGQAGVHFVEEKTESFDEREDKMVSFANIFEELKNEHFPWVQNTHWLAAQTMALISVFFDESLWRPPHSSNIVEILASSALDLSRILKGALVLKREHDRQQESMLTAATQVYHQNQQQAKLKAAEKEGKKEEITVDKPAATSSPRSEDSHHEDDVMDLDSDPGQATPYESEAGSEIDVLEVSMEEQDEKEATKSGQASDDEEKPMDIEAKAAHYVAEIVERTRPSTAFPGRNKMDIMEIIVWELRRIQDPELPETWRWKFGNGSQSRLLQKFPQFSSWRQEFGSRQFLKWKDTRNMAARRTQDMTQGMKRIKPSYSPWGF